MELERFRESHGIPNSVKDKDIHTVYKIHSEIDDLNSEQKLTCEKLKELRRELKKYYKKSKINTKCENYDSTLKLYNYIVSDNTGMCTLILNKKYFPIGFGKDMWEVFRKRCIEIKFRRRKFDTCKILKIWR